MVGVTMLILLMVALSAICTVGGIAFERTRSINYKKRWQDATALLQDKVWDPDLHLDTSFEWQLDTRYEKTGHNGRLYAKWYAVRTDERNKEERIKLNDLIDPFEFDGLFKDRTRASQKAVEQLNSGVQIHIVKD